MHACMHSHALHQDSTVVVEERGRPPLGWPRPARPLLSLRSPRTAATPFDRQLAPTHMADLPAAWASVR